MFKSEMYKKFFPITETNTQFTEKEKRTLCSWARDISKEDMLKIDSSLYEMELYDWETMVDMINQNRFDERYLFYMNAIIYRHKYNAFLSLFIRPVLTEQNITSLVKQTTKELPEQNIKQKYKIYLVNGIASSVKEKIIESKEIEWNAHGTALAAGDWLIPATNIAGIKKINKVEIKGPHWIMTKDERGNRIFICSVCGHHETNLPNLEKCKYCGKEMSSQYEIWGD